MLSTDTIGFRKGRSILDNLSTFVSRVQLGFSKKQSTIACFVDIDSAYNNVNLERLLDILDNIGIG